MLLTIYEDEHGWIYEPHGTETECWSTYFEGSLILFSSGWRPYEMHRVSRHVHDAYRRITTESCILKKSQKFLNQKSRKNIKVHVFFTNLRNLKGLKSAVRIRTDRGEPRRGRGGICMDPSSCTF